MNLQIQEIKYIECKSHTFSIRTYNNKNNSSTRSHFYWFLMFDPRMIPNDVGIKLTTLVHEGFHIQKFSTRYILLHTLCII